MAHDRQRKEVTKAIYDLKEQAKTLKELELGIHGKAQRQEQLETSLYYLNHQQDNDDIESLQDSLKKLTLDLTELKGDLASSKVKETQHKADMKALEKALVAHQN